MGSLIVSALRKKEEKAVAGVYLNNQLTVFQVVMDGTTLYNQIIAKQIHNTVMLMEKSSLHSTILIKESEDAIGEHIVNFKDYIGLYLMWRRFSDPLRRSRCHRFCRDIGKQYSARP